MQNSKDARLHEALDLINQEENSALVESFKESIDETLAKVKGEPKAVITSAIQLSKAEKKGLETLLGKIFHREMRTAYEVSPRILGGLRIQVGDWKLDATLSYQLDLMRGALRK